MIRCHCCGREYQPGPYTWRPHVHSFYTYPAEVLFTAVAQQVPLLWPNEPSRSPEAFAEWIVQKLVGGRVAEGK